MAQCHTALELCTNLESFSWTGGGFVSNIDSDLVSYVDTIINGGFPLRDLVVRASPGLSAEGWNKLKKLTSLRSLGISCLIGEHDALAEWCRGLSATLTRLDLVVGSLSDTSRYMECEFGFFLPCEPEEIIVERRYFPSTAAPIPKFSWYEGSCIGLDKRHASGPSRPHRARC